MVALAFASCAYDPYYGSSYSVGYGEGYGYGGSSFSTSVFVSTGNPQWGYDPDCHSYYDYQRRCYYDPYLYGYYPVGYRPVVVYGAPHPYGWSPGRTYISPPSRVTNVTINNYRDRESAYRNSNYSWARQVQSRPSNYDRPPEPRQSSSVFGGQHPTARASSSGNSYYQTASNSQSMREGQGRYSAPQANQPSWGAQPQQQSHSRSSRFGQTSEMQSAPQPRPETQAPPAQQATSFGGYRQQATTAPAPQTSPFGRIRQESQPAAERSAAPSFGGRPQAQPSSGRPQAQPNAPRGVRKQADEPPIQ